jgi:cardiolipin synthase A/B
MTRALAIALLVHLGLSLGFSLVAISRKREPVVTLAWVMGFFLAPYLGILLYVFFGYRRFRRRRRRKPDPARRALLAQREQAGLPQTPPDFDAGARHVERLATHLTGFLVTSGNQLEFYEEADSHDKALAEAIRQAKHHVHLEYYIFEVNRTGAFFRDLLIEKAREGVRCRLLLDAVGSFGVGKSFLQPLREAGVRVAFFSPVRVFGRPWGFHLRNHRKIAVIDGTVGFVGSQNIGTAHLRWRRRRLKWRDTAVRVDGLAAGQLQIIFAEDWHFTTGEDLSEASYFPKPPPRPGSQVQTLPTGPDGREQALHLIFLAAIHSANERITVTTPYFVPSTAMALALEGAAHRGVRVELLLPKISDQPVVSWAGRSWYQELLENGVRIFEYAEAFIHAKVLTVDGGLGLVGSANMDIRSFLINYETSLLIYDPSAVSRLQSTFDATIERAQEIRLEHLRAQPFTRSLLEGVCRLLSPLL